MVFFTFLPREKTIFTFSTPFHNRISLQPNPSQFQSQFSPTNILKKGAKFSSPNSVMEGKDAKRRLVQSSLFPHKETAIKAGENCDADGEEAVVEEEGDEEWCGSSKKRRGTKKKGNSKLKTTPRASLKKVAS